MELGYNTNGTAFHRWQDAIALMAEVGYKAVAITIDNHCLSPFSPQIDGEVAEMKTLLTRLGMTSVIETGARFLLDPHRKHEPTLLSPTPAERERRIEFLCRCIDIAEQLQSQAVSFWSGACRVSVTEELIWDWLTEGCQQVADYAGRKNVRLAFEPEPGMFIERMDQFERLDERLNAPHFGLTMDIGHVHCVETNTTIGDQLRRWADRLYNVHIEDMKRGVHEHLQFGDGEIDFASVIATLKDLGYEGPLAVELSRHSHRAPDVMRESFDFLSRLIAGVD